MELSEVIEARRSIRKFRPDPIPDKYVAELFRAANLVPSGNNLQPTRYVVIKSEEARRKLSECTPLPFVTKAPVIMHAVWTQRLGVHLSKDSRN